MKKDRKGLGFTVSIGYYKYHVGVGVGEYSVNQVTPLVVVLHVRYISNLCSSEPVMYYFLQHGAAN